MFIGLVAIDMVQSAILFSYISITLIIAPILFLLMRRGEAGGGEGNTRFGKLFAAVFFVVLTVTIATVYLSEIRPQLVFILITIMASCITAQILCCGPKMRAHFVLFQVVILFLCAVWGQNLNYYFYFGRTDPFAHAYFVNELLSTGHITEAFGVYHSFPLWHINTASLSLVLDTGMPSQHLMFLVNGFVFACALLISFFMVKRFFTDTRMALFSALFIALFPSFLIYGASALPRSAVILFEVCILFLLLMRGSDVRHTAIAVFLGLTIVVYHTISIPFILIIIGLLFTILKLFRYEHINRQRLLIFVTSSSLFAIVYWSLFANDLLVALGSDIQEVLSAQVQALPVVTTDTMAELFNYVQYSLFLLFIILALLFLTTRGKYNKVLTAFCVLGISFSFLALPGPTSVLEKVGFNLNLSRFDEYASIFLGITTAFGFVTAFRRSKPWMKTLLIAAILMLCFSTVSNDFVSSDNPVVKRPFFTSYLTLEDVTSLHAAQNLTQGPVDGDFVEYRYYYFSPWNATSMILDVNIENGHVLKSSGDSTVLIRQAEVEARPLMIKIVKGDVYKPLRSEDGDLQYFYPNEGFRTSLMNMNCVYSTPRVHLYA